MPEIRVTKQEEENQDISNDFMPKKSNKKGKVEISNFKIMAEASKYVADTEKEVYIWKNVSYKRLMPETREQATLTF